jgi:hypothetical protein
MFNRSFAGGGKTLPMTVKNTGFLLDRLGQDCHPLQFLRELTQNSIQAIQRTEQTGQIVWDADWNYFDLAGVMKLCVMDTGDGMTGSEMVEHINKLSSSGAQQSFSGNYGVGAKIAAATRNHAGMVYLSYKNGHGAMIHMWRNPEDGTYGLIQQKRADGTYSEYVELEDEVKPDIINQQGTKIVLFGNSDDENTMKAPPGTPSPSRWIAKYLNTRFYKFPDGITIKAREGWEHPRSDTSRNKMRTITGQEAYLNKHKTASGEVSLKGAIARWWILEDSEARGDDENYNASTGHAAALYQDELYELATGRTGVSRLQQFGVIFGHRLVVIYIEPQTSDEIRLTTNTARTNLLVNNEPLPWADWAAEFREKMPQEIEDLIAQKAAASSSSDHSDTVRDRLKGILDLFKLSRYRPTPSGKFLIDDEETVRGGQSGRLSVNSQTTTITEQSQSRRGGTIGNIYTLFQKKNGSPGEKIQPDPFPKCKWISVAEETREPSDLEDKAARFLIDQNLLLINSDFRAFTDMISRWHEEFGGGESVKKTVEEVVRAWFEQALVETVMGIQALQGSKEWSQQQIISALSEEALTAAVMQRYHVNNSIKRELGSKLGKFQNA